MFFDTTSIFKATLSITSIVIYVQGHNNTRHKMSTEQTSYAKKQIEELEILAQAVNILSSTLAKELEKEQIDTQLALDIAKTLKIISRDMRERLHWLYETIDLDLNTLIEEARKELQKQIQP
ncbi:MAG: hypothetical protein QW320_05065 [Ignisphaera sp.]